MTGIYRFLKARRFDIVHTHSSKAGIVGRVAARWAGAPVIIHTPHGHVFYGYFGPIVTRLCLTLERWCARFTDRIITLTERGRREHLDFDVGLPEQYSVIPSGIPLENFFPDPGRGWKFRRRRPSSARWVDSRPSRTSGRLSWPRRSSRTATRTLSCF